MNCSDDVIRRVKVDKFEETIETFEIVRITTNVAVGPILGLCMDQFTQLDRIKNLDYKRRDSVILIPMLILGNDHESRYLVQGSS